VVVAYEIAEPNWRLTVSDNGKTNPGLGTTIIEALAKQLNAGVEILMNPLGTPCRLPTQRSYRGRLLLPE
jgi:two-component sensor histidine kinase